MKFETHDFYCLNCGKKGIPIARKQSKLKADEHRKKLYCPFCKVTVNHFECKSYSDVLDFQERYEAGEFVEEAKISIQECN